MYHKNYVGRQSEKKKNDYIDLTREEVSQSEAHLRQAVKNKSCSEQLLGLPKCVSPSDYPLFKMWYPVKCPDDNFKILPWAIQRGMMARELTMVAAALISNDVSAVKRLTTLTFQTAVMTMVQKDRSLLARFLNESANRLLRWRVVDVGANKGYVLTDTIEALLGHLQQADLGDTTHKSSNVSVVPEWGERIPILNAKLALGGNGKTKEINKYTTMSLALGLLSQYEMQHPSREKPMETPSSIGATDVNTTLVSTYLPIRKGRYMSLCGACCECGKIVDRALEKALSGEGLGINGDGNGGRSIDDLTLYRPRQLEIHAYEPSIINYRWLAHFYNPNTTRMSTVSEYPPSSSHYLGLGVNILNISIYNMGVGKTPRSAAVEGGNVSTVRRTSAHTVAYFPILDLGDEVGKITFKRRHKYSGVVLTSLDEHLLPILRQREVGMEDDKLTRVLSTSKIDMSGGGSGYETIRPHTSTRPLYFPIDVLYTDTEGFDEKVAQGADFLLSNNMVAMYQFEMVSRVKYKRVFNKLSSYNYVCYFETESVKGAKIPKLIRITHGCWRKEYKMLSGWMNAVCYHRTLLKHSSSCPDTTVLEGNGSNVASKEMSSLIDWDSLITKQDPDHFTIDVNSEVSRKWAGSLKLQPLRGIFASSEQSYHNMTFASYHNRWSVARALVARYSNEGDT